MKPIMKRCPCCGGDPDVTHEGVGDYRIQCTRCGLRSAAYGDDRYAAEAWNRRYTEQAQVLTLQSLSDSEWCYEDEYGNAAVWLEKKGEEPIFAAVVRLGNDFGTLTMSMLDEQGAWHNLSLELLSEYGRTWRLWDKKPSRADRHNTAWNTKPNTYGIGIYAE